jgi:hypothetical protein
MMVGTSRQSINKVLHQFQAEGLLRTECGNLVILEFERLKLRAGRREIGCSFAVGACDTGAGDVYGELDGRCHRDFVRARRKRQRWRLRADPELGCAEFRRERQVTRHLQLSRERV